MHIFRGKALKNNDDVSAKCENNFSSSFPQGTGSEIGVSSGTEKGKEKGKGRRQGRESRSGRGKGF